MWSVAKALQIPFDPSIVSLTELPHTLSFVIRKMQQIDNLAELPKEKRPPDEIIWDGTSEELEEWIDRVFNKKEQQTVKLKLDEVEG